jgi:hypothetical protein
MNILSHQIEDNQISNINVLTLSYLMIVILEAPQANNTPQIMLLLHMQIRRYFNNICDNNNICYTLCEYRTTDYWVDDILVG